MRIDSIKSKPKGQVSVFIIIAVILVIGTIFFLTYNSGSLHIFTADKNSYKIKQFVEGCLDEEITIAENEMGMRGGWLYHPPMRFTVMDDNKYLIKDSKGFDTFGVEMPYWYYYDDSQENFMLVIPEYDSSSQYSMKNQLKRLEK